MDRELSTTNNPDWDKEDVRDHRNLQFEKGYLWEGALSRAFGEKAAIRPCEVELDGVVGSPDGIVYDKNFGANHYLSAQHIEAVEEYKCTALSAESTPASNWKWLMQVKGYCKMLGVRTCVFRVLHHVAIMHDPANAYAPWELVFTQDELDENWQAILNHKRVMEARDV